MYIGGPLGTWEGASAPPEDPAVEGSTNAFAQETVLVDRRRTLALTQFPCSSAWSKPRSSGEPPGGRG
jgi:hypothetical protein